MYMKVALDSRRLIAVSTSAWHGTALLSNDDTRYSSSSVGWESHAPPVCYADMGLGQWDSTASHLPSVITTVYVCRVMVLLLMAVPTTIVLLSVSTV